MFWPQTLLARSVLLIAALLLLAHLAWLQIFRVSTREPRARQVSQQIVSTVNLTRAALVTAEPSKRFGLLGDIAEREGVQVHAAQEDETLAPLPKTGFYEFVEADLRAVGGRHPVHARAQRCRRHLGEL
jgi:two-component system, OmpR family, osmolarity sensor histidine kinase EnvZ